MSKTGRIGRVGAGHRVPELTGDEHHQRVVLAGDQDVSSKPLKDGPFDDHGSFVHIGGRLDRRSDQNLVALP
jgi:hypothetical protein